MEEAFKTVHEKLPPTERPGKSFMAKRLAQVEDNDPIAEPRTEVTSCEDGEDKVKLQVENWSWRCGCAIQ